MSRAGRWHDRRRTMTATLPGPSRTITVEPIELPREEPEPRERPEREEPVPEREPEEQPR